MEFIQQIISVKCKRCGCVMRDLANVYSFNYGSYTNHYCPGCAVASGLPKDGSMEFMNDTGFGEYPVKVVKGGLLGRRVVKYA